MYVLHVPLGIWWAKLVGTGSPYWSFLGYFAMLCLVSVMLHLYFEVPLRTRLVRIFEERK